MTITLELPPEMENRLLTQAKLRGLSLDVYLMEILSLSVAADALPTKLSPNEANRLLDGAADLVPAGIAPLSDHAMGRDSIYTHEDE